MNSPMTSRQDITYSQFEALIIDSLDNSLKTRN
uniref:Uncharacterized protein n=1 Tax=Nelumbo nucifera TaxID=4432 RepID=A0A822ZSV4_NELNU|nr:TPA_asm: hypothetical protein HUJ06_016402 [Nelumbo nucifera]